MCWLLYAIFLCSNHMLYQNMKWISLFDCLSLMCCLSSFTKHASANSHLYNSNLLNICLTHGNPTCLLMNHYSLTGRIGNTQIAKNETGQKLSKVVTLQYTLYMVFFLSIKRYGEDLLWGMQTRLEATFH